MNHLYAIDMQDHRVLLEKIFPQGVCDYRLGDAGRPADLWASSTMLAVDESEPVPDQQAEVTVDTMPAPIEVSLEDSDILFQTKHN